MGLGSSRPHADAPFDLCVVGAGPVGLSLALEAASLGLRVLVVEAGGSSPKRRETTPRSSANVLNTAHHAPVGEVTVHALGGTSWLWGGRCVPFEPIDYERRDHVPNSGWPVSADEITRWHARASAYVDCGGATFRDQAGGWAGLGEVELSQLERWSRRPKLGRALGAKAAAHPGIVMRTGTTVNDVVLGDDGDRVDHLRGTDRHGRAIRVVAHDYAIACGGLGTTRLLLSMQARSQDILGGDGGPLGRYYMGHITGSIATIVLTRPDDVGDLDFTVGSGGAHVRRRFTFSSAAQRAHRLLNTSFYIGNPPLYDHRHRNPTLSLVVLAMAMPVVGRIFTSRASRRRHLGGTRVSYSRHLMNVLRHPWRAAGELSSIFWLRYLAPVRRRVFIARSPRGEYALQYHAEQIPNRESRIWLNDTVAPDGLPNLDIDFRYSRQDVESVLRAHELLDERLRSSGKGRLRYLHPKQELERAVMAQALDGYHQIGTTRMSSDPALGVVDAECRVHGMANLYLASSSCFPTAGEANPTFMAVCLGVRLAHRLHARAADSP
ncbi:FAD-dependent oxidoreductase [Lysobacter korlensis]|uniref:FAD-dependent oxidoreductase n=1 Tax=Lysobacter korlensis TaxID=553636 RepID=A0ABV6RXM1_9GAMM